MRICFSTAPEIVAATQKVWQREKELELSDQVASLVKRHDARGLSRERIARVLAIHAQAIEAAK